MDLILGVVVGLIVGWWFLPQPDFIKAFYAKLFGETPVITPVDPTPAEKKTDTLK